MNNNDDKKVVKGLFVLLFYLVTLFFEVQILSILGIDINKLSSGYKILCSAIYELFIIIIIVLVYSKELKKSLIDLKKNYKKYFTKCLKYWLIGIGITYVCNCLLLVFNGDISTNETAVRSILNYYPVYMIISSVIYAPIVEELVFRCSIRYIFKNDYIYMIISGLLFGLLHTTTSTSILEFLYFIPYSIPGITFAYMVVKTKNITVPICFHLLHNSISILMYILVFLLKG